MKNRYLCIIICLLVSFLPMLTACDSATPDEKYIDDLNELIEANEELFNDPSLYPEHVDNFRTSLRNTSVTSDNRDQVMNMLEILLNTYELEQKESSKNKSDYYINNLKTKFDAIKLMDDSEDSIESAKDIVDGQEKISDTANVLTLSSLDKLISLGVEKVMTIPVEKTKKGFFNFLTDMSDVTINMQVKEFIKTLTDSRNTQSNTFWNNMKKFQSNKSKAKK